MTLKEAREDMLAQARLDLDLYKGVELDAEGNAIEESVGLTDLISRACFWWAKLTYSNYQHSVALTLTAGTAEYDCRNTSLVGAKILQPRVVVINDNPLVRRDGREYGLWTMPELQRYDSQWRLAENDVPILAVWLPGNKLLLHHPPESTYTGKNFIEGWTLPNVLDSATDENTELPIPEEDHLPVIRFAITLGSLPNVTENEAWQRLSGNDAFWREHAERRKRENTTAFLGRRTRGSRADWMYQ